MENNKVSITGTVSSQIIKSNICSNYMFDVSVCRGNGITDSISVCVSERLIDVSDVYLGKRISVVGEYRSFVTPAESEKQKIKLCVVATSVSFVAGAQDVNEIRLTGHICNKPMHRKSILGHEVTNFIISVNDNDNCNYFPCTAHGKAGLIESMFRTGNKLHVSGRIKSREFMKGSELMKTNEIFVDELYL